MTAAIWTGYGSADRIELGEVETPVPRENEIRVRVHAASVSTGDSEMRALSFRFPLSLIMRFYAGFFRPKRVRVLGQELAGVVDAVGSGVADYQPGDHVIAQTDFTMGAHAQYRCIPAQAEGNDNRIAPKPAKLSFEEAAAIPLGGLEALKYLRAAELSSSQWKPSRATWPRFRGLWKPAPSRRSSTASMLLARSSRPTATWTLDRSEAASWSPLPPTRNRRKPIRPGKSPSTPLSCPSIS